MIVQIDKLLRDVRTVMDMNRKSASLIDEGDIDTLELNELIVSKIEEGARLVLLEAPNHLLEAGHQFEDEDIEWFDKFGGRIVLPEDFLRLIVFRMSDWRTGVWEAITADSDVYKAVQSNYKGYYGTVARPVVAIVQTATDKALEFYSCNSDEVYISQAVYTPIPKIIGEGIELAELCYKSIVYRVAYLALASMGETNLANGMLEISKSLIQ